MWQHGYWRLGLCVYFSAMPFKGILPEHIGHGFPGGVLPFHFEKLQNSGVARVIPMAAFISNRE